MSDALFQLQDEFTDYFRQTSHLPADHPHWPALSLYQQLIRDNLSAAIQPCFPILSQILPDSLWQQLIDRFLQEYHSQSPFFHQLPGQFVQFLKTQTWPDFPFAADLAHYEWLELVVDTAEDREINTQDDDLLDRLWPAQASIQVAAYHYPVERIAPNALPTHPEPSFMLVYRNQSLAVEFVKLNELSYVLLNSLFTQAITPRQAIAALCQQYPSLPMPAMTEQLELILARLLPN